MASGPIVVQASTSQVGGAEASLLASLDHSGLRPLFLLPGPGPLARELETRGWPFRIVPWPRGLEGLTQGHWLQLPLILPGLLRYLLELHRNLRGAGTVWSSGLKSHAACLLLSPWHRGRIRFDIRDFIRPAPIRRLISLGTRLSRSQVMANSRAVARDYPGARVEYPSVRLERPAADKRRPGGRKIITHLAYFAPYKGQDLFLTLARKLIDAGVDAEFWIIGDVIYPAPVYARYRDRVHALVGELGLSGHVRFLGKVGAGEVQSLLEQAHLLLHCTREPEPFGRAVLEALLCGCEAVCHRGSGVCEVTRATVDFRGWMAPLGRILGEEYVRVSLLAPETMPPRDRVLS